MGKIDYRKIYDLNKDEWKALTREPQKYEALLAGHYSDSNHFVYELLQNAEDAKATRVVIEYYEDKLIFYHNGKPFDENDVKGVSSMLMGTKDKNDASTIGKFGMGFKSVFKYTYQPEIYSDDEAFCIENYLFPVELDAEWDYQSEKTNLSYEVSEGSHFIPFASSEHLTKFVIPFAKKKDDGRIESVPGNEVLAKLESLSGEILLFLTHIKLLYWVDRKTGKYAKIMLSETEKDENLITCRIEGTAYSGKEDISRYLKYKKVFAHPDMSNAEVSVAYKVNNRANNINEMPHTDIWVYFPTRDNTELPFLVHGSFETAVSREKLMTPSLFNNSLFDELGNLVVESLNDLKKRKMITQVFIRRVLMAAFKDEENNNTIPGLKEKITESFKQGEYLPDREGGYRSVNDIVMAVPFGIADFYDSSLFAKSFERINGFVAFNNEREANFTEYFYWLINELDVHTFTLDKWADGLLSLGEQKVDTDGLEELKNFYSFLSDNRESLYSSNLSYTRSGPYERMIKNSIVRAWEVLKRASLILNSENTLVPAIKNESPNIYLGASSQYKNVIAASIVNNKIAREFDRLLEDGFEISDFDNFQYIKEKIIKKYVKIQGDILFDDNDNFEEEYIEDIRQIIKHIEDTHSVKEMQELLEDAYIIKIKKDSDEVIFARPGEVHTDISDEGIDLDIYYEAIPYEKELEYDDEENEEGYSVYDYYGFDYDALDKDFYLKYDISIKKLNLLGLITTPVDEGNRKQEGVGDGYWSAIGEYCPQMEIDGLDDNLEYIERHPNEELARQKSKEIFKLVLTITDKLRGKVRYRKMNPYEKESDARCLRDITSYYKWVYCSNGKTAKPTEVSKYDIDVTIYGELLPNKEKYEILGFIETNADNKADAFELVDALDKRDKKLLLKQLARELGMHVGEAQEDEFEEENVFQPEEWVSTEFPVHKVRNKESLVQHVREQFFCADPVKYMPVLRQIRVSKSSKAMHAYVFGMYMNESNIDICQMCKEPAQFVEATEIANFGIELPQFHLCLCKNCASRYKAIRDSQKDRFKKEIHKLIISMDVEGEDELYEIGLNSECSIAFTQIHLAEVQILLSLIDEYGLPDVEENEADVTDNLNGPLGNVQRRKEVSVEKKEITDIGAKVKHKSFGTGKVVDCFGDRITILFDGGVEKTFDLAFCRRTGAITIV